MAAVWMRNAIPLKETKPGKIASIVLSLVAMAALSVCLSRRVQDIRDWRKLPFVCWLVLLIYMDSLVFTFSTAIISNAFGVDSSKHMCSQAVLICLCCYMTTKVMIYYFLVERVYIIRSASKPRLKSKLYIFNSFGMMLPYLVVIALNFHFRFAKYEDGTCVIGMEKAAMIPLIAFDILVNVYLTTLFIIPLRNLYSYKTNPTSQTRTVALRTFIGSCATLVSSVVNLTVVMVLNGEPGWICLMCCNLDILFSVLVLHWLTAKDNAATTSTPPLPAFFPRSSTRTEPRYELRRQHSVGCVTTFVTTGEKEDEVVADGGKLKAPPNVITVHREMRIEDGDARSGSEDGILGGKF